MEFLVDFSKSAKGYNAIWVVVDKLTKSAHFLPVKMKLNTEQFTLLYVKEIIS